MEVNMKIEAFFKFLFWFITTAFIGLIVFIIITVAPLIAEEPDFPEFMTLFYLLMLLFLTALLASIAVFVYRDAPKKGMSRWTWMTIATFGPNLIGLIIYIILRHNNRSRCLKCGNTVKSDYEICPYCGSELRLNCSSCGKNICADWKVCPYCRAEVTKKIQEV